MKRSYLRQAIEGLRCSPPPEPAGASNASRQILILDDMQEINAIMNRFARLEGFAVHVAESNAQAFDFIRDEHIFSGLRMAFLDVEVGEDLGFEVYNAIRSRSMTLPVIIMSGSSYHKMLYPILAYDACASFLAKPFSMQTIRHLMREPLSWGGDMTKLFQSDPLLGHHELAPAILA